MTQLKLHVQNLFDVLNPLGSGVNGYLKQKCIQVQSRVVDMASPGDIVVISDDCPQAFVDYMLPVIGSPDVMIIRYELSRDLRKYLSARTIFEGLETSPQWSHVINLKPTLNPYMQSPAIYEAARKAGLKIPGKTWKSVVVDHLPAEMNDKGILCRECDRIGAPVPPYWITKGDELIDLVVDLLKTKTEAIYIRQARSAGAFGNLTVERINSKYVIREFGAHVLDKTELARALDRFIRASFWDEYVVTELLDLYASPGSLFYVDDNGVNIICHTYQMLNRSRRFLGFMYPILDRAIKKYFVDIVKYINNLLKPWWQLGFRGYGNVDWMITNDGKHYIAELNARQTAVVPAINIENRISRPGLLGDSVIGPSLSIFTIERVYFEQPVAFEEIYSTLKEKKLLWEQSSSKEGIVITIPPSLPFGINSVGMMAIGDDLISAYQVYNRALRTLNIKKISLLFEPVI